MVPCKPLGVQGSNAQRSSARWQALDTAMSGVGMIGVVTDYPSPDADGESAPFWEALRQHRLVLQRCDSCGRSRFPFLPSCPYCASEMSDLVEISGAGTIYSWIRVERALTPAMASEVPYSIATVDLDGGGRIFGRLYPAESAEIGLRVSARFFDRESWTELQFEPAAIAVAP
jgi:uncharacterized OB-fold protein